MKIKRMAALTALFMLIAVFVFSLTVFAEPVDSTTAPAAPVSPAAPTANDMQTAQPTEAPAPTLSPNAITPNGQGSVLNYYENDNDDKQFYTITTPAGNVFYLVVDGARGYENVYFLNAVTENDLMALAAENDRITISAVPSSQTATEAQNNRAATSDQAEPSSSDKPEKGEDNSMTMYIIIGAAFVAVAGIGVYAKIIRPKKDKTTFEDEDEAEDYGEEEYGRPDYLPEDDFDDEE